jgi:drug/metabolite transporter (DMT)-like permease
VSRIAEGLQWLAVTVWVGALWSVGLLVAPTLFQFIPDRILAGSIAVRLFTYTALLGIGCAGYLLLFRLARFGSHALRQAFFWVVLVMLVLALVGQFGVHPILEGLRQQAFPRQVAETVLRARFDTWHGIASVVYVVECALGVALVLLQPRAPN